MRTFASLLLLAGLQAGNMPPQNLKVLTPDVNLQKVMRDVTTALGVQCNYCHQQGNFASDENPKKEIARNMFRMVKEVALNFPDTGNDFANSKYLPFPEGKQYVTCYTCHQGQTIPLSVAPDPHGPPRAPEPGEAPRGGGRGRGAGGAQGQVQGRGQRGQAPDNDLPPGRVARGSMNMVVLPSNADTFLVMPAFRAAIGVECNFCHVFGEDMTRGHTNERQLDGNPKKLIARNMLRIMQRINTALFPTEDIDIVLTASSEVPEGKHFVTCYMCHRGNRIPLTAPSPQVSKGN